MKIAIYGAGECGRYVAHEIEGKDSQISCNVFIDNNLSYMDEEIYGVPVVGVDDFLRLHAKNVESVLVASMNTSVVQEMVISLLNREYTNIYLLPDTSREGEFPILNDSGTFRSYVKRYDDIKPVLPYLEYHVSDYCNLKCKGCGHFSNRVSEKQFPDISQFRRSLESLAKKFRNIALFRLMGGEPFTNPDLKEFICAVKETFPYSTIQIVTNGLLFTKIDEETVKAIRQNSAVVDVSQYPPTRKRLEDIMDFAQRKDIKMHISRPVEKFAKQIRPGGNNDPQIAFRNCFSKTCHFLQRDHVYPCGMVPFLWENRDFLGADISEEILRDNSFNLKEGSETGWEILKRMACPLAVCKYCASEPEWFAWSVSEKEIKKEDWIIKEGGAE